MKLYNYDYSDQADLTLSYDPCEKTRMTSKVYPTKLEIKMDEEAGRPYLYYEGITQTNHGPMMVTFPRLDLALDGVSTQTKTEDELDLLGRTISYKVNAHKMITEFHNLNDDEIMYELRMLSEDERKDVIAYLDEKYGRHDII